MNKEQTVELINVMQAYVDGKKIQSLHIAEVDRELKPEPNDTHGEWMPQGRFQRAKTTPEWRDTLEGRK